MITQNVKSRLIMIRYPGMGVLLSDQLIRGHLLLDILSSIPWVKVRLKCMFHLHHLIAASNK